MEKFTLLAALALGFGCSDKDGDSTGESDTDTDADTDTDTDSVVPDKINVDWGTDSVAVTITGGSGDYDWGITQGGPDPWIAEDCIGGTNGAGYGPWCKTVTADSTTTFDCVSDYKETSANVSLFCDIGSTNEASLTYYFASQDDKWCGVTGPDASIYSSYGCEAL